MFNNPIRPAAFAEEGSITEVDPIRKVCKVKTLSGQNLTGVSWAQPAGGASRAGDRVIPTFGDRVMVDSSLGYPIISMFLPKLQNLGNATPIQIDTGELLIDTGNFSVGGRNVLGDQNAPGDLLVGDRLLSSPGGGLIGLLRAGSLVLRSSRLSEIFLSKLNDLVRISSRNYEHFTDVSSDVIRNVQGRIYRYIGYSKKIKEAKVEAYTYNQYIGDVALAEEFKTDYTKSETLPAETEIIFKEQVFERSAGLSGEVMKRELFTNGNQNQIIKNIQANIFTHVFCTKDEIIITYKDVNIIKINKDEISFKKNGDPRSVVIMEDKILSTFTDGTVLMNAEGITTTYKDGKVKMDAGKVETTFQGATHKVDGSEIKSTLGGAVHQVNSSGVKSTFGGAVHEVNASGVSSTFGGHFVKVTAGGVALG